MAASSNELPVASPLSPLRLVPFALAAGLLETVARIYLAFLDSARIRHALTLSSWPWFAWIGWMALGVLATHIVQRIHGTRSSKAVGWIWTLSSIAAFWLLFKRIPLAMTSISLLTVEISHYFTALLATLALFAAKRSLPSTGTIPANDTTHWIVIAAAALLALRTSMDFGAPISPQLAEITTGIGLLAVVGWSLAFELRTTSQRTAFIAVCIPLCLRVALAFPAGLVGVSVGEPQIAFLVVGWLIATAIWHATHWPKVGILRALGYLIAGGSLCVSLGVTYLNYWGKFETRLAPLVVHYAGFTPPYPSLISQASIAISLAGLFFLHFSIVSALSEPKRREIGLCLALIATSGIGLDTGANVLGLALGLLALSTSLRQEPVSGEYTIPSLLADFDVGLASLGLGRLTAVDDNAVSLGRVHGPLDGTTTTFRISQPHGRPAEITIIVGRIGSSPVARARGKTNRTALSRKAATMSDRYVLSGETTAFEFLPDALTSYLLRATHADVELHHGGVQLRWSHVIHADAATELAALTREIARWIGKQDSSSDEGEAHRSD